MKKHKKNKNKNTQVAQVSNIQALMQLYRASVISQSTVPLEHETNENNIFSSAGIFRCV